MDSRNAGATSEDTCVSRVTDDVGGEIIGMSCLDIGAFREHVPMSPRNLGVCSRDMRHSREEEHVPALLMSTFSEITACPWRPRP